MSRLDRSRPYGENWGGNGLESYVQDGRLFRTNGEPYDGVVDVDGGSLPPATETAAAVVKRASAVSVDGRSRAARAAKRAAAVAASPSDDLASKTDAELQAMVDIAGGTWTDRKAAIAMLSEK